MDPWMACGPHPSLIPMGDVLQHLPRSEPIAIIWSWILIHPKIVYCDWIGIESSTNLKGTNYYHTSLRWRSVWVKNSKRTHPYIWLNTKMGSPPAVVYTTTQTSLMENFNCGWNNDMIADTHGQHFFSRGSSPKVKFLGQPQIIRQTKLGLPPENSNRGM